MPDATHPTRIELYEDNAGGLYFLPVGEGFAIYMRDNGDFLTDARLYRDSWDERDVSDHDLIRAAELEGCKLIASYRPGRDVSGKSDGLTIVTDRNGEPVAGSAGLRYLAASLAED